MSFGVVAASYLEIAAPSGIIQQYSGIWTGTTMSVSLPGSTAPTSTIVLFVAGNTLVPTPAGWTLRESQVNEMGHYLFTRSGGTNSWSITTNSGMGTWYISEIANSTYDVSASANDMVGSMSYTTPTLTPTAGNRLLLASIGSNHGTDIRTVDNWTDSFTEVADVCYTVSADYPMQGVAMRTVVADGSTGYQTSADYSLGVTIRTAIITAFTI